MYRQSLMTKFPNKNVRKIRRFGFALFRVKGRTDGQDERNNNYSFLNSNRNKAGSSVQNGAHCQCHNKYIPRNATTLNSTVRDAVHNDHYVTFLPV